LSLKHNKDPGIMLIYEELNKILEKQGLSVINTKGEFNPKIHEAVIQVNGEKDGIILEEIQRGYLLNHKLLRASKVKISKVTQ
jgi:molecular chaperone GrpE